MQKRQKFHHSINLWGFSMGFIEQQVNSNHLASNGGFLSTQDSDKHWEIQNLVSNLFSLLFFSSWKSALISWEDCVADLPLLRNELTATLSKHLLMYKATNGSVNVEIELFHLLNVLQFSNMITNMLYLLGRSNKKPLKIEIYEHQDLWCVYMYKCVCVRVCLWGKMAVHVKQKPRPCGRDD